MGKLTLSMAIFSSYSDITRWYNSFDWGVCRPFEVIRHEWKPARRGCHSLDTGVNARLWLSFYNGENSQLWVGLQSNPWSCLQLFEHQLRYLMGEAPPTCLWYPIVWSKPPRWSSIISGLRQQTGEVHERWNLQLFVANHGKTVNITSLWVYLKNHNVGPGPTNVMFVDL